MRFAAGAAMRIWVTCLTTGRHRQAFAIALIRHRCVLRGSGDEWQTYGDRICDSGRGARSNKASVAVYKRGLTRNAKPNPVLLYPCIGKPSAPSKRLSAFNSFLFENSNHHRAVAI
jgi:hypothetical protein